MRRVIHLAAMGGAAMGAAALSAGLVALGLAGAAMAQANFPEKPIRYVLHVSPGGATDVMARKLAIGMEKALGKSVIVENKAGGRGAAQMVELTTAKPDGYTIGAVTSSHIGAFNQTLKQFNVDSVDWLAGLVTEPYLFVVQKDNAIGDMKAMAEAIKAKPGFVVSGFTRGAGSHFAWEMYAKAAGLPRKNINWVPYDSVADAVTAVLGKHGQTTVGYLDLVKDHVTAGNIRVIGVMTQKRMSQLPKVPTLAEQGFPVDTAWQQFRGVIAPKGIPEAIKSRLAEAIEQAMATPEMKKYVEEASLTLALMKPAEVTAYAKKQDAITKEWMKALEFVK